MTIEYEIIRAYAFSKLTPKSSDILKLPPIECWNEEFCDALCCLSRDHICEFNEELQSELTDEKLVRFASPLAENIMLTVNKDLKTKNGFVHFYTSAENAKTLYVIFSEKPDDELTNKCLFSLMKGLGLLSSLQPKEAELLGATEPISKFGAVEENLHYIRQIAYLYQCFDAVRSTRQSIPENEIAYELIQNANDAKIKSLGISDIGAYSVTSDGKNITIEYTEQGFSLADILAISVKGISGNRKTFGVGEDRQTTGHKGTGFTSIYRLFDTVEISSRNVNILLDNTKLPNATVTDKQVIFSGEYEKNDTAKIEYPFPVPFFSEGNPQPKTTITLTPNGKSADDLLSKMRDPDSYLFTEQLHQFKYDGTNTVDRYITDKFYRYEHTISEEDFISSDLYKAFESRINSEKKRTVTILFPKNLDGFEGRQKVYCDLPLNELAPDISFIINIPMLQLKDDRKNIVRGDDSEAYRWNQFVLEQVSEVFSTLFNKFAEEHPDIAYRYFPYSYINEELCKNIFFLKPIDKSARLMSIEQAKFLPEYMYHWCKEFGSSAVDLLKAEGSDLVHYSAYEGALPTECWIFSKLGNYKKLTGKVELIYQWYSQREIFLTEGDELKILDQQAIGFYNSHLSNDLPFALVLGHLITKKLYTLDNSLPLCLGGYYCIETIFAQLEKLLAKSVISPADDVRKAIEFGIGAQNAHFIGNIYDEPDLVELIFSWIGDDAPTKLNAKNLGERLCNLGLPENSVRELIRNGRVVRKNSNRRYNLTDRMLYYVYNTQFSIIDNERISFEAKERLCSNCDSEITSALPDHFISEEVFSKFVKGEGKLGELSDVDRKELLRQFMKVEDWLDAAVEFIRQKHENSAWQVTVFQLLVEKGTKLLIEWNPHMKPLIKTYNEQFLDTGNKAAAVRFTFDPRKAEGIKEYHKRRFGDRTSTSQKEKTYNFPARGKLTLSDIVNSSSIRTSTELALGDKFIFAEDKDSGELCLLFSNEEGFDRIMKELFGCDNFGRFKAFPLMRSNRILLHPNTDWHENAYISDEMLRYDTVIDEINNNNLKVLFDSFQSEDGSAEWCGYGADVHRNKLRDDDTDLRNINNEPLSKCPVCHNDLLISGGSVRLRYINAQINGDYIPLPFLMCLCCDNMFKLAATASLVTPCAENDKLPRISICYQNEDPVIIGDESSQRDSTKKYYRLINYDDIRRSPEVTIRLELKNDEDDECNGYFRTTLTMQHRLILLKLIGKLNVPSARSLL